jgi:SAM-dependent methyltransferase
VGLISEAPLNPLQRVFSLSLLEIWDFISGTNEESPYDRDFANRVDTLISNEMGPSKLRILDMGGGSGNPSIGLAHHGHRVEIVDVDSAFVSAARRRIKRLGVDLKSTLGDWRGFLSKHAGKEPYDVIICLGNALAYQDSWPDKPLPSGDPAQVLLTATRLCKEALRPGGLLLLELAIEEDERALRPYIRFHPALDSSPIASSRSIWFVECKPDAGSRKVDTCVVSATSTAGICELRGRVVFNGWLFTRSLLMKVLHKAGMIAKHERRLRPMFDIIVLRNET